MTARRTAPGIGDATERSSHGPYPLAKLIEDARHYLATRSYDSEERMVLRWCVDELEKREAALRALLAVRPENWADDDDPELRAAWLLALSLTQAVVGHIVPESTNAEAQA